MIQLPFVKLMKCEAIVYTKNNIADELYNVSGNMKMFIRIKSQTIFSDFFMIKKISKSILHCGI